MVTAAATTVRITLEYKGQTYVFDWETYGMARKAIEYIWNDGNWDCDCNRSLEIQRHCDAKFRQRRCGEKIKLVSIEY